MSEKQSQLNYEAAIYHSPEGQHERFRLLDAKEELIECGTVIFITERTPTDESRDE